MKYKPTRRVFPGKEVGFRGRLHEYTNKEFRSYNSMYASKETHRIPVKQASWKPDEDSYDDDGLMDPSAMIRRGTRRR